MAQQQRIGTVHTTVKTVENNIIEVTYHGTAVVQWNPIERLVTLDTGGYFTATTKTRMNQASNQFKIGYQVFAKDGKWYAKYRRSIIPFGLKENGSLNTILTLDLNRFDAIEAEYPAQVEA